MRNVTDTSSITKVVEDTAADDDSIVVAIGRRTIHCYQFFSIKNPCGPFYLFICFFVDVFIVVGLREHEPRHINVAGESICRQFLTQCIKATHLG